jgi:DNA-binding response OmpR family regulator
MRHILVVDDQPDIRTVVEVALAELGHYRVSTARTGDEALPVLDRDRPDLVLLDAVMPGMPAMEFALHATQRDIPLIMMSGNPAMGATLDQLGWAYLHKPFRLGHLLAECAATIARHKENLVTVRASLRRVLDNREELAGLLAQARRSVDASQRLVGKT